MARTMIIMSPEEHRALVNRINELETKCKHMEYDLKYWQDRSDKLYDKLNRPAIEASVETHRKEELDWCAQIAEKYEQLDYNEWITDRAKFYNNGVYDYCKRNGISEEEAYATRQYDYAKDAPIEFKQAKPEGWSDLKHFNYGSSWIMHFALNDIDQREQCAKTKEEESKYRRMWLTWYDSMTSDEIGKMDRLL